MTPNHRTSFQHLPSREDPSAKRAFAEFTDERVPVEYGYYVTDSPGSATPAGFPTRTARELMNGLYRTPGSVPEPANPENSGPSGSERAQRAETILDYDREDTVRLRGASHVEDSPEAPKGSGVVEEPEPLEEWDDWEEWEEEDAPGTTRRTRWGISPRALVLVALIVLAVIIWGVSQFSAAPRSEPVAQASIAASDTAQGSGQVAESAHPTPQPSSVTEVRVHVAGAVNNPGVYTLPANGRAVDAIAAASGAAADADLDRVNLAGELTDGMQLYVPRRGETAAPAPIQPHTGTAQGASQGASQGGGSQPQRTLTPSGGTGTTGTSAASQGSVNINTATAEQLQSLPRIGPAMAQRIIAWREAHGGFRSVDELDAVPGIGPTLLETLRPLVTV